MNEEILVSVYCLAYNHENYIEDTLKGFLKQKTNFKFEVIVHDDASTDKTAEIIKKYEAENPEIIKPIYQKENQYSKGIDIVDEYITPILKGRYVAECEGDDYWSDELKLQKQVEFLEEHSEYCACVHNTSILDMETQKKDIMYPRSGDRDIEFAQLLGGGGASFHTSSLMTRIEHLSNLPEFCNEIKSFGDYTYNLCLGCKGKIRFIDDVMSVYRYRTPGSWSSRTSSSRKKKIIRCKDSILLLERINEYSGFQHDLEIRKEIERNKFYLYELTGECKKLKEGEMRELYLSKPWKHRLKINLKQMFLPLYRLYIKER